VYSSVLKVGVGQYLASIIDLASDRDFPTCGRRVRQPVYITHLAGHADPTVRDRRRVACEVAVCIKDWLRGLIGASNCLSKVIDAVAPRAIASRQDAQVFDYFRTRAGVGSDLV
jgi:hypothetical protein